VATATSFPTERTTWWSGVQVLVRRELRDTLRDWRMVIPIVLLTLVFPVIMTFTANAAQGFVNRFGTPLIGERLIPFLLMIVGFFPISFSLVIALETFVGERERKSLEPLLATPLSNGQLYLGKMLASMIPPLLASYLGIAVYLLGLSIFQHWSPSGILLAQILALTTVEAIVMVSGAVVVSTQATSVRGANLLASFIIIPMALLVQAESLILFLAAYDVLWGIVLALMVVDLILVRMGLSLFNREELLGREIDQLNPRGTWRKLRSYWASVEPGGPELPFSLLRMYRFHIPAALRRLRSALIATGVALLAGIVAVWIFTSQLTFPPDLLATLREGLTHLRSDTFSGEAFSLILPRASQNLFLAIFENNASSLLLGSLLSLFSFGAMGIVMLMAAIVPIGAIVPIVSLAGLNPLTLLVAFLLPHGIFELPAAIIATAAALQLGAALIYRRPNLTVGEGWLHALVDWFKLFIFVVLPLLLAAALIEAYVTPRIVCAVYGCT
jgi:uncharacterized membrane protein SpoIIM required for sporulation/ABC-type transport system involved in multi-copper enzyme maturation permease subunit